MKWLNAQVSDFRRDEVLRLDKAAMELHSDHNTLPKEERISGDQELYPEGADLDLTQEFDSS